MTPVGVVVTTRGRERVNFVSIVQLDYLIIDKNLFTHFNAH